MFVFILALSFVILPAGEVHAGSTRSASGGTPQISVSPTTVNQGESIQVTGSGFSPNVQVTLYLGTGGGGAYVFHPTSSSSGSFSYTMLIGTNVAAGQHDVRAEDPSNGSSNTVWITVNEGSQQTTVTFTFIVVDADSGSPISGASVWLDGSLQGSTGSDGRVGVSTTYPPANHGWSVSASGYQDASGSVSIGSNSGGSFTVHLTKSASGGTPQISVSPTTVNQGQSITVSGTGFYANGGIIVYVGIGGGSAFSWDKTADGSGNLASFQILIGTNVPTGQRDVRAVDQTTGTSSNTIWITVSAASTGSYGDIDLPAPNNDPNFHYWAHSVPADYYTTWKSTIDETISMHYNAVKALMNAWGISSPSDLGCDKFTITLDGTRGGAGAGSCDVFVDANTQKTNTYQYQWLGWSRGVLIGETANMFMHLGGTGGYPRTWWVDDIWYLPGAITGKSLRTAGYSSFADEWLSQEQYTTGPSNSMYFFWDSYDLPTLGKLLKQIKSEGLQLDDSVGARKLWLDESACLAWGDDGYVNDPGLSIKSTYMMVELAYVTGQDIKSKIVNYQVQDNRQPSDCQNNKNSWTPMRVDAIMYDQVKSAHDIVVQLPKSDPQWQYWLSGDYDKIINPPTQTYTASTGTTITQASTVLATTTVLTTVSTVVTSGTTTTLAGLQMQVVSNSTVSNLIFDSARGLLNFTVSGPQGTYGFFDATVAKTLLSGQPVVLIDGVQTSATVSGDTNFWYIHVTYPHSQHHVTIGGSNTVPEFPSVSLLAIVLVLVIVIFRRRDKR